MGGTLFYGFLRKQGLNYALERPLSFCSRVARTAGSADVFQTHSLSAGSVCQLVYNMHGLNAFKLDSSSLFSAKRIKGMPCS